MNLKRKVFVILCVLGSISLFVKWFKVNFNSNYYFGFTITYKLFERNIKLADVKYVLLWNHPKRAPLSSMPEKEEIFNKKQCAVKNCYITSNMSYFNNVTNFDVILFHGPETVRKNTDLFLPKQRTTKQIYIFVSMESADYYYVPDNRYNQVFNLTWTYKLNSDIYFGYIIIKDLNGKVIGPKVDMSWISIDDMTPINETIIKKLKRKKLAAAWFVSNCKSLNNRHKLAMMIKEELIKYNMSLDMFGECWYHVCPRNFMDECLRMLQRDYYFYLAFENSMSDDYVTEKLLSALQHYVVPVVFGGADYKRFMPDGIYLNARNMSVVELVHQMVEIINDENRYHNFFKWHNHYSYHSPEESADTDRYCEFCDFINNIELSGDSIDDFFQWWNPHVILPA